MLILSFSESALLSIIYFTSKTPALWFLIGNLNSLMLTEAKGGLAILMKSCRQKHLEENIMLEKC